MKGVFIQQQIESRLEIPKDEVVQGEVLPCTLTLKNHSGMPQILAAVGIELVYGKVKEIGQPDAAVDILARAEIPKDWSLGAGESKSSAWSLTLDRNCPIAEKSAVPYFRFGNLSGPITPLQLGVKPHAYILSVAELLESSFQFVRKGERWSKGWTELKFKPSVSKKYSMLNELQLGFHFEGELLGLRFAFNVKKFDSADASSVKIGKGKSSVEKLLEPGQYLLGGHFNHAGVEAVLGEALETVATGF